MYWMSPSGSPCSVVSKAELVKALVCGVKCHGGLLNINTLRLTFPKNFDS